MLYYEYFVLCIVYNNNSSVKIWNKSVVNMRQHSIIMGSVAGTVRR